MLHEILLHELCSNTKKSKIFKNRNAALIHVTECMNLKSTILIQCEVKEARAGAGDIQSNSQGDRLPVGKMKMS